MLNVAGSNRYGRGRSHEISPLMPQPPLNLRRFRPNSSSTWPPTSSSPIHYNPQLPRRRVLTSSCLSISMRSITSSPHKNHQTVLRRFHRLSSHLGPSCGLRLLLRPPLDNMTEQGKSWERRGEMGEGSRGSCSTWCILGYPLVGA